MPPLAASEAKSLTVRKRQGHRPAFHQNNPNILVKIETDSSMSPVNVLEGNFGLTRPLINWPMLSLESLQVAATRSGLCVLRPMQLLQRRRHRAGWKFCGYQRHTQVLAGLNDFTLSPAGSKPELATPNAMIPKEKRQEKLHRIIRSKIVLVAKSRCMNIQWRRPLMEFNWRRPKLFVGHYFGTPKSTSSDYQLDQCPAGTTSFHGLEPSKASHRQFPCDPGRRLQATQLAEIKLPCLDVVHGSGWPGTQADDLATASLGTCNILTPVGYTQPEWHQTSSL